MNGFAKSLGIAVVALGLGVSFTPEAFAIGSDTWKVEATSFTTDGLNNAPDWIFPNGANSFSLTWERYMNDYVSLTFLKIGGVAYHDENGGDFSAEWKSEDSKWDVLITNSPLKYTIFLMGWDPHQQLGSYRYPDLRHSVNLMVLEQGSTTPQGIKLGLISTHAYIRQSVPEPSSLLGLTLLGAIGSTLARKKQKTTELS